MFSYPRRLLTQLTRIADAAQQLATAANDIADLYYRDAGLTRSAGPDAEDHGAVNNSRPDAVKPVMYATDAASFSAEQADVDAVQEPF